MATCRNCGKPVDLNAKVYICSCHPERGGSVWPNGWTREQALAYVRFDFSRLPWWRRLDVNWWVVGIIVAMVLFWLVSDKPIRWPASFITEWEWLT